MFDALQIAATGMHAQQLNVDAIANNLANVNTVGFKKAQVNFSDLVTRSASPAAEEGLASDTSIRGTGVAVASIVKSFDAGEVRKTDSAYDITIAGDGFFEVVTPDGSRAFARGGTLKVNGDGQLATLAGHVLKPGLSIPENVETLSIAVDGKVSVTTPGRSAPTEIGQIDLVRFIGPAALDAVGDNLYRATSASGEPIAGRPGVDGMGTLRQGYLEASNVKLVQEMVNLMIAQRAYEASVKVAQASDEMLGMVNNLRK
jgi:flagellar basal-body rod protein FlgG